jgi:hypothetical protein
MRDTWSLLIFGSAFAIYEVVGRVKRKIRQSSPFGVGRAVKGAVFSAFILTLDSPAKLTTMERGTKRNEVQWSFRSMAEGFVFC